MISDRRLAGDYVVIRQGSLGGELSNVLRLNETGVFLWRELKEREFDAETVAGLLEGEFGIGREEALRDAYAYIEQLRKCDLTDE